MSPIFLLLVGPSGVGKSTILAEIRKGVPGIRQLPTETTRPRRPEETEGVEHFFLSEDEFNEVLASGDFIEWQVIHGYRYGTRRSAIQALAKNGCDYVLDMDSHGALALKAALPDQVVTVLIEPPSIENLRTRLTRRGGISEEVAQARLSTALAELAFSESADYIVVNDDLSAAIGRVASIIEDERRRHRTNR